MASIIKPGSVVWAKCGSNFWPAEVLDFQNLPDDIREDFANGKEPAYTVKFFDEDGQYVFFKFIIIVTQKQLFSTLKGPVYFEALGDVK